MTKAPVQINLLLAVVSVLRFYFQSSGHFDCINEPVLVKLLFAQKTSVLVAVFIGKGM